jgi:hypothetical protein
MPIEYVDATLDGEIRECLTIIENGVVELSLYYETLIAKGDWIRTKSREGATSRGIRCGKRELVRADLSVMLHNAGRAVQVLSQMLGALNRIDLLHGQSYFDENIPKP